jgi:hypothetical protein
MRGALSDLVLLSLRFLSSLRSKDLPKIERFSVFALQINPDSERYAGKLLERWGVELSVFKNPRKSALICLENSGEPPTLPSASTMSTPSIASIARNSIFMPRGAPPKRGMAICG